MLGSIQGAWLKSWGNYNMALHVVGGAGLTIVFYMIIYSFPQAGAKVLGLAGLGGLEATNHSLAWSQFWPVKVLGRVFC